VATSFCFLSTYPPTQCGLATFTGSLLRALTGGERPDQAAVVRIIESPVSTARPEVVEHLRIGDPRTTLAAADALNRYDVAIVQHDFASYGGADGEDVLAVLDLLRVPVIAVLHSVPRVPTSTQRVAMERVAAAADAMVTMTETARTRLLSVYQVDPRKVRVIPHGAVRDNGYRPAGPPRRPTILTWGLMGPGKGIEWALVGLREIKHLRPLPRYVVAGQTHPKVRASQGEAYRLGLGNRARALGISDLVRFEHSYLDEASLARLVDHADIVLLPYDSSEQVTSGVLVEAVAACKPVVATAFPHAVELLGGGAGVLVPHRDGPAIGAALQRVLTEPHLATHMSAQAALLGPTLGWPSVADRYRVLGRELVAAHVPATR
jgi:glycosyltransferase involved in cell wall biosynthesis